MIAFYLCAINPFRLKSFEQVETIENILTRLGRYEGMDVKIRNEKWIKAEEAKLEAIKTDRHECEEFYQKQDRHLEKIFASPDGTEIKDEALWKNRYIQMVNVILDRIKRHGIVLGTHALPFKERGPEIPTWDQIIPEQKRFWVTDALINILLKEELDIVSLESINFLKEGSSSANAYAALYDVIPFTMKISMNFKDLLFFINEFIKSSVCLEIKTIKISGGLNRLRSPKTAEESYPSEPLIHQKNIQSSSVIDVVIEAYALDFKI